MHRNSRRVTGVPREARCVCECPIVDHQPLRQAWYNIVRAWVQHRAVMALGVILGHI